MSDKRVAALTEQLEEAQERIRQLEELASGKREYCAPACLQPSPSEEIFLGLMLRRERAEREALFTLLYGDRLEPPATGVLTVFAHRLRRKLATVGVTMETARARGWSLSPAMKARLIELSRSADPRGDPSG